MDELGQKARLEIEFILKGLNESLSNLQKYSDQSDEASRATERYRKAARSLNTELGKVAREQSGATKVISGRGAATRDLTAATRASTDSIIAQRYALYDVASTYGILGASLVATSGYAIKLGADFESAFTNVERTLENGQSAADIADIRNQMVDLSTQIPKTFAEISKIATLGNQLGIDAEDLTKFTELVAQFSTVTGISSEASAQAFGRIRNILGLTTDDFDNLASAIVYIGRTTEATEPQIIALVERLGATATRAGLTAAEIVGLSGAIASLAIAPERAQGVFETYFNRLNTAVADGGKSLQDFATISGKTTEQVSQMVRGGQGLALLESILRGLAGGDTVEVTTALQSLGLQGLRASEVMGRLATDVDGTSETIADSVKSYTEAAEITAQYALVVDDLNSQWMIFTNSVNALIESLSGGAVKSLADVLGELTKIVNKAREFSDNPVARNFATTAIAVTAVVGAFLLYRSVVTLATASTFALTTAQANMTAAGTVGGIRGLIAALTGYTAATGAATVGTNTLKGAVSGLIAKAGPLALVAIALGQLFNFGGSQEQTGDFIKSITGGIVDIEAAMNAAKSAQSDYAYSVASALGASADDSEEFARRAVNAGELIVASLFGPLAGLNTLMTQNSGAQGVPFLEAQASALDAVGTAAFGALQLVNQLNAASGVTPQGDYETQLAAARGGIDKANKSMAGLGRSAGGAAKEVRTLADYASDLGGIFDRSFEIRFGSQLAIDSVRASWQGLNEEIAEYRARVLELTADRAVKEYFLSVANAYGDTLRAGVLTAEIAGINNDLADAQAGASTQLKGNSKAAIENRKRLTGLIGGYQEYIQSLAASGKSQAQIAAAVAKSKAEFIAQATALGYSNSQLKPYIASFNDMAIAVAKVPRNITVTANTNPALQALNEFRAKAAKSGASAGAAYGSAFGKAQVSASNKAYNDLVRNRIAQLSRAKGNAQYIAQLVMIERARLIPGYADGGYTGDGGKYQPKGVVHGGEFVFSKEATRNIGVQNLARQHSAAKRGYAGGGPVGGGTRASDGIVELGPRTLRVMREEIGNTILNLGDVQIAQSANRGNRSLAGQGVG